MVESFGEALRRRRESAGMSQPQLARLVPISQASLSRYEREAPPWNYDTPALLTLERGLVYQHLGRNRIAADLLAAGLDALPPEQRNAEWVNSYQKDLDAARSAS